MIYTHEIELHDAALHDRISDAELAQLYNLASLRLAENPMIVSYTRIERSDCCPVCEAVHGLVIDVNDTATYDEYELLHFNCYGMWWANFEDDPGADIRNWQTPPEELRAKYMEPSRAGLLPDVSEIKQGIAELYKHVGIGMPAEYDLWTAHQWRDHYREIAAIDIGFVSRFRRADTISTGLALDFDIVTKAEKAMASGVNTTQKIRAFLRTSGFDDYRILKYTNSVAFGESLKLFNELNIFKGR